VTNEKSTSTGSSTPRISGSVAAPAAGAATGTTRLNMAFRMRMKPAACALPRPMLYSPPPFSRFSS